jgi:hypothetical protein
MGNHRLFFLSISFFYQSTGEYAILDDYEPYGVFQSVAVDGAVSAGGGINYCEDKMLSANADIAVAIAH